MLALARTASMLLWAVVGLGLTGLSCTGQAAKSVQRDPRPDPPVPAIPVAGPPPLPALERARLDYLFNAVALVAHTWSPLAAGDTCILLIAQATQWVVHCDEAPRGFARAAGSFRDRPVFVHEGSSFDVSGQTRSTQQLLSQSPAAAHVFATDSAAGLPVQHPWLLLGTLEALREFHPAFGPASTESWLSVAVHEFIHIHQLRTRELAPYVQPLDTHALDPATLTALYEHDARFRSQVTREYQQLVAAAERAPEPAAARAALRVWLSSYRSRSKSLAKRADGEGLLRDERLFTYLEGVARFVESDFLQNLAQHPASGLEHDPQFHDFAAFVGHGYRGSPNRQLDAQYYYAIGYHLCVLLDRVDPRWQTRVQAQPGWLIGVVEQLFD